MTVVVDDGDAMNVDENKANDGDAGVIVVELRIPLKAVRQMRRWVGSHLVHQHRPVQNQAIVLTPAQDLNRVEEGRKMRHRRRLPDQGLSEQNPFQRPLLDWRLPP